MIKEDMWRWRPCAISCEAMSWISSLCGNSASPIPVSVSWYSAKHWPGVMGVIFMDTSIHLFIFLLNFCINMKGDSLALSFNSFELDIIYDISDSTSFHSTFLQKALSPHSMFWIMVPHKTFKLNDFHWQAVDAPWLWPRLVWPVLGLLAPLRALIEIC